MTEQKTIVIGVCGGIAAYKAAELASALTQKGFKIEVIMTEAAQQLVAPLTFRTLTGHPVRTAMFHEQVEERVEHIALAERADLMVIVPATANILGKVAGGIADDLLSTTIMAAACPVMFFPAMNVRMWENALVQGNVARLRRHGYHVVEPDEGYLACGSKGKGRLLPVAAIEELVLQKIAAPAATLADLAGLRVLVSAGPTVEPLDPVRFLSNRSSGKMGYALAGAALARGARVDLVSGPVHLTAPAGAVLHRVETASEMKLAIDSLFEKTDIVIMAAAVADYRAKAVSPQKIKKETGEATFTLEKTPDILADLGQRKGGQFLVGFAAETQNLAHYARQKMVAKNLDMIVANDISRAGAGFATDTNIVTIFRSDGTHSEEYADRKEQLAHIIFDEIMTMRRQKEAIPDEKIDDLGISDRGAPR